jgi:hypothetical protein
MVKLREPHSGSMARLRVEEERRLEALRQQVKRHERMDEQRARRGGRQ